MKSLENSAVGVESLVGAEPEMGRFLRIRATGVIVCLLQEVRCRIVDWTIPEA